MPKLTKDYKRLLSNFFSLSVLQVMNLILPLITLPYLIRVLKTEYFGLVMFAQSFILYFSIFVDFGFNFSATREISINRHNKEKISEVFSVVMQLKLFLLLLSFIIMLLIINMFHKFESHHELYYITFLLVIGQSMFPVWYFQGNEDMKYVTYLNLLAKIIFTILVFVFVKTSQDYLYVPLLNGLGYIIAGLFSLYLIKTKYNEKIKFYSLDLLKSYLKDSMDFFLSRVSVSVYTSSNAFVLGLFTNNITVGYYSIAEKLYNALRSLYGPVSATLYPYIANKKNVILYKKIFITAIIFNLVVILSLWISSPWLIELLSGQFLPEANITFRILLIVAVIAIPSSLLGYSFLAALGYKQYANNSVIIASLFHLSGLFFLYLFDSITLYSVLYILLVTESIVFAIRLYGIKKHGLWKTFQ